MLILFIFYILINTGELSLLHVPSTVATVNTHANVFFVFLPGGISKEWRHMLLLFRQIVTLRGITLPISYHVYGPFGEHLGRPKIAHGSHNDVRRLCWLNLGCESPLAETPKGSLCWENLCGWGWGWLGGTDCGDCGRKVSTQRKHACVFAGSDGLGKCKRITLKLSSVLTYIYTMYIDVCM